MRKDGWPTTALRSCDCGGKDGTAVEFLFKSDAYMLRYEALRGQCSA
jgi:hypothetical protein